MCQSHFSTNNALGSRLLWDVLCYFKLFNVQNCDLAHAMINEI